MKLCTFKTMVGPHLAVKTDQGIADLNIAGYRGNMDDLIYGGEAENRDHNERGSSTKWSFLVFLR